MSERYNVALIGGGIVGVATAMALLRDKKISLVLIEAEEDLAHHQTGNNSGVVHSGLYYKPGSLKAKNCTVGREALYEFCKNHGISFDRCGKVVVATERHELPALERLEERGRQNGLSGLRRLSPDEIREIEPHCKGIAGLFVPQTGIVDFVALTKAFGKIVQELGGVIKTKTRFFSLAREGEGLVLECSTGQIKADYLINCAGLQSDRVAKACGVEPGLKIIPFRGEYYEINHDKAHLIKNLIYPVPDPRFPFLGVHFTRMILGGVEAGPNAVFAFKREGYKKSDISFKDLFETFSYAGFWKMMGKHWKMGLGEIYRSFCKKAFVRSMQRMVPEIRGCDVKRGGAGVRAQALERDGFLVDDFRIVQAERMIHVLNAPSPAATASIAIGQSIAAMAEKNFEL